MPDCQNLFKLWVFDKRWNYLERGYSEKLVRIEKLEIFRTRAIPRDVLFEKVNNQEKQNRITFNPIPGRGAFCPPPISIRHNFFLVIAMKLKFSKASQLLIRKKNFIKIFFKKYAPLWNYDVILKGCAPFFNWCIYLVIVTGFVCLLPSIFFMFGWC